MKRTVQADVVSLSQICSESRMLLQGEAGKRLKRPAYFVSMRVMLHGAFSMVSFFERMHQEGKVYLSDSPAPFRFHLKNGEFYCLEPERFGTEREGSSSEVSLTEFTSPEVLEEMRSNLQEVVHYSEETDLYFVSVYLFEYFFHTGSPFEGKKMVNRCFLSPLEKELYRVEEGQFCMEIGEPENAPVKGIQDKLLRYWNEYPVSLQKMFQKAFLSAGTLCELRPTLVDWKQLFVHLLLDYKECECGFHGFSNRLSTHENGTLSCPKCRRIYYPLSDGLNRILLTQGEKLYECQTGRDSFDYTKVTGIVVENRQKKGLYGIKNVSHGIWRGMFPGGQIKEIGKGQAIPIWNHMQIRFEKGEDWTLRLVTPVEEQMETLDQTFSSVE